MIDGLFETHLFVRSLETSMDFYGRTLGLERGHLEEGRRVAFYWIGGPGEAMLGLWERPAEEVVPQHMAFRCRLEDVLDRSVDWLAERRLEGRNFLRDGTARPMVFGWMPALAIYFDDPDGHELELIAMLPGPARPEVGVVSYEDWQAIVSRPAGGPG